MAKTTLPTNYKDDILNSSMGGKRRYKQTTNADGTVSLEDVSTYDQVGSNFGASQLNAISKAVNESADSSKIISDPDTASATTEQGYIADVQLFNHLNDSLNSMGGYDLIGTYAKPQVIEIDLSKYKSVSMITTHTGGYHYQPVTIPVDLLKTSTTNLWQIYFSADGNEYYATFKYVDDTHIQLTRMNGFVNAMFLGYK